ncbi:Hypothetical protein A7982_01473 [Minicystis rosea]|nr:Hypothetical protein A7982_01473 [Minicystis rosea]
MSRSPVVGKGARADVTHDAVVTVRTFGTSLCSGTIIRRNEKGDGLYVLTAAHCCRSSNPPRKILIGADYADPVLSLPVTSFQPHPCYNPLSNDYDFCVLEVPDKGELNVTPIPLVEGPDELEAGDSVTVVGFGSTPASNTIRRRAEAQLAEVGPLAIAIDQRDDRPGICFGDSGGPVLIDQGGREVVAGVVSFGAPTSLCNVVGAAERISFRGVRDEFLDKVLKGQKSELEQMLVRRDGPTPGAVRDTYLSAAEPDQSFGNQVTLLVGSPPKERAPHVTLMHFDLSAIPAGATILTARMGMHQESKTGHARIFLHRVTRDWDEQQETWSSFGREGFDPSPFIEVDNSSTVVTGTEEMWFNLTELATRWAAGEVPNRGILLQSPDDEQTEFISSEIGRIMDRPWMSVCYLPAKTEPPKKD